MDSLQNSKDSIFISVPAPDFSSLSFQDIICDLHAIIVIGSKILILLVHTSELSFPPSNFIHLRDARVHLLPPQFRVWIIEHLRSTAENNARVATFGDEIVTHRVLVKADIALGTSRLGQVRRFVEPV